MNKIYILISEYCNEVDAWDSIIGVFERKDIADYEAVLLEKKNDDPYLSYFVQEWEVK